MRAGGHSDLRACRKLHAGLAVLQLIYISNSLGAELHPLNPPLIHEALQPVPQSEMSVETAYCQRCCSNFASSPLCPTICPIQSYSHHKDSWGGQETSQNHVNLCLKSSTCVALWCRKMTASRPNHKNAVKAREEREGKHKVSYPAEHHPLSRAGWPRPCCSDQLLPIQQARLWSPCLCVSQHS